MRRSAPGVFVTVGLLLLLGSYVWYVRSVLSELRREAEKTAGMFHSVYAAASDPSGATGPAALFAMLRAIRELDVPVIVTDSIGKPTAAVNLPFGDVPPHDPRVAAYVRELDRENPPVTQPDFITVHFGYTPLVRRMQIIPVLQAVALGVLLVAGFVTLRARGRAERERVWAGMARESAHQLGTPLSSLHGWLELLGEREDTPMGMQALQHMAGDVERLERVAHRFERIGRPPKREPVDVGTIAAGVVAYFAARLPTLAQAITLRLERDEGTLQVAGDPVLMEWALESLVKNAIDALAGRGGTIIVSVHASPEGGLRVRVVDDGPGVPRDLRRKIFSPGFTTKERGWGIGLALTRRIVEEGHGGRLILAPSERGAAFEIVLAG